MHLSESSLCVNDQKKNVHMCDVQLKSKNAKGDLVIIHHQCSTYGSCPSLMFISVQACRETFPAQLARNLAHVLS